jgi:hypothetical protein
MHEKIKFRNVLYATYAAKVIIAVNLVVLFFAIADELNDAVLPDAIEHGVLEVLENTSLVFVFCFRFTASQQPMHGATFSRTDARSLPCTCCLGLTSCRFFSSNS